MRSVRAVEPSHGLVPAVGRHGQHCLQGSTACRAALPAGQQRGCGMAAWRGQRTPGLGEPAGASA